MIPNRRDVLILAAGALAAAALPARAGAARVLEGPAFGASWRLVAADFDAVAIRVAFEAVVASVDAAMSPFRAESELSRFNAAADTGWHALSRETCLVLAEGLRIADLTGGAFNPTLGPLVARYGFGPISRGAPGQPREIGVRGDAARKARAELSLDLCGIAKGRALDRMAAACAARGIGEFLIELGGEVLARGRHPSGRAWQVAVEGPAGPAGPQRALALEGAALATSGRAVNSYTFGKRRYGHIIDPQTGAPAGSALFSVTVAAATAMEADGLATALYAMGGERGLAFARANGIEALFLSDDGTETAAGGFENRILA